VFEQRQIAGLAERMEMTNILLSSVTSMLRVFENRVLRRVLGLRGLR
jgi:hypothetical protein